MRRLARRSPAASFSDCRQSERGGIDGKCFHKYREGPPRSRYVGFPEKCRSTGVVSGLTEPTEVATVLQSARASIRSGSVPSAVHLRPPLHDTALIRRAEPPPDQSAPPA